jgi:uncharacterized membrane protein
MIKKPYMTPEEYYSRRTIIDEMEEKRGCRIGCLILIASVIVALVVLKYLL